MRGALWDLQWAVRGAYIMPYMGRVVGGEGCIVRPVVGGEG